MTMLSEDPTILVVGLVLLGIALLMAMRVTQQGAYLVRAGIVFGLAGLVLAIEWFWVTDNERIERVVDDLRGAVARADVNGVLEHLAPNVQYGRPRGELSPEATREMIRAALANASFDFVRVSQLQTNVGRQSRRGTADFRVLAKGRVDTAIGGMAVGSANSEWSLGFQEVEPHVWKVNRITPMSIPDGVLPRVRGAADMPSPVPIHSAGQATRVHASPKRYGGR